MLVTQKYDEARCAHCAADIWAFSILALRSRSLPSSCVALLACRRARLNLLVGPFSMWPSSISASAASSSSRACSSARNCEVTVLVEKSRFLASILLLASWTSPLASTSAASWSLSSSISSISSWSSATFSAAASKIPLLPFSSIHPGTSSPASFSSAALHAAQRLAHLASSCTSSSIHLGTSLPSDLKRLDSWTAHLVLPLFSSSVTILSIHAGTVSFCSRICFTIFLVHSRVWCCCMRSFLCAQVSWVSFLHHVGALSGRGPKEPSTKLKCSSPSTTSIPSLTEEALDCRRKVPSCWAIAPPASREAKQTAVRAMILRTGAETR
mmetsp:Transcript_95699/g.252859  ORF Transcript_95699/g.252859 Transcript_95699/m.252859 type:complete len:326 (-) Transcript_95699:55-1032(-)